MESCSNLLEFSPLMEIYDGPSVVGENGGKVADSASQEPRRNDKEENEDGDDEVFSSEKENNTKLKGRRPGRPGRKRTSEPGSSRNVKYPCGVCSLGVGYPGVICGACGLWIHNGKNKKCTGLNGKEEIHADTFRCPKCIKRNREINLKLRNKTLAFFKDTVKNCKSKEGGNGIAGTKRTLQDPSPKGDDMGNLPTYKKQKVDIDFRSVLETQILKVCIDCLEDYEATYDELGVINCWSCGLASHGCRSHQKTQVMELYKISKGHIWLCYECKREALTLKKKNQNWEEEVEVEVEHSPVEDPESFNKDIEIEIVKDLTKNPETEKGKLSESEDKSNKSIDKSNNSVNEKNKCKNCVGGDDHANIDKSKSGGTPSESTPDEPDTSPTGQKNTDKNKSGSAPSGSAPSKTETPSAGQRIDTLRLNINALTRTS